MCLRQNAEIGMKPVWYGARVLIEKDDADHFTVGETVTFINWGNLVIKHIDKFVPLLAMFLPFSGTLCST